MKKPKPESRKPSPARDPARNMFVNDRIPTETQRAHPTTCGMHADRTNKQLDNLQAQTVRHA
jgi:hypothetical protein